jgi:hypothetical protein
MIHPALIFGTCLLIGTVCTATQLPHLPQTWQLFTDVPENALSESVFSAIPDAIDGKMPVAVQFDSNLRLDIGKEAGTVGEKKIALLYGTVEADDACSMQIGAGADWWMEWYVNGEKVYSTLPGGNRYLDFIIFDHRFELPLQKGTNIVIAKVLSGSAGWKLAVGDEQELARREKLLQESPLTALVDQSKVTQLPLPDLLAGPDGKTVSTKEEWLKSARPHILHLLEKYQYGRIPREMDGLSFQTLEPDRYLENAGAWLRTVEITVSNAGHTLTFPIQIFMPSLETPPAGVFIKINHRGRDFAADPDNGFCPITTIMKRNYALVNFDPRPVALDNKDLFDQGALQLYPELLGKPNSWRTISAWAWGVMRIVDYLASTEFFNPEHIAVIGHSRSAETATWAGANDTRIALTCANNGNSLFRRDVGQAIAKTVLIFPHWFNDNFDAFANNEATLPFDFHMLVAAIAPRQFHLASAALDINADPMGQYLGLQAAEPAYQLFGMSGLPDTTPTANSMILGDGLSYHIRIGRHDITDLDWGFYMDNADRLFK